MTFLGSWNRRLDRDRNLKAVRSPVTKVRPSFAKRRPRNSESTSAIDRHLSQKDVPFEPVKIDNETVKAMEIAFRKLDAEGQPSSVTALAVAMAHRSVLGTHANMTHRSRLSSMVRQMKKLTLGKIRFLKDDDDMKRRYEIIRALNRLEKQPTSSLRQVSNWEEAKQALMDVFIFPEDEEEKETKLIEGDVSAADITSKFQNDLEDLFRTEEVDSYSTFSKEWRKVAAFPPSTKMGDPTQTLAEFKSALAQADEMFRLKLESETVAWQERARKEAVKEIEDRQRAKELEEEARKKASSLMRPLSKEETQRVMQAIRGNKPPAAVIAQCESDSVQQQSMWTLQPGQWVNDEVIHYFLLMLTKRDEEMCKNDSGRKRSHFFKSFFITKLLNEGHVTMDGQYEYRNVKRWSKKVPGKDLFSLDKVFFPINQGQMHWLCACAFMQEKRVEVYDSMGSSGTKYLNCIFKYLQDDYKDKKGKPMPDVDEWKLVTCKDDTPQQRNGYDCGVFTCMFIDFLSKDCPLVFSQDHVNQCRERIALSILNGKAIM